jgi:hypothetical protein
MPQIAFRADDDLTKRIDRLVKAMKAHPSYEGVDVNRSMAIRVMVYRGLASMELQLRLPLPEPEGADSLEAFWVKRERDALDELEAIRARIKLIDRPGITYQDPYP